MIKQTAGKANGFQMTIRGKWNGRKIDRGTEGAKKHHSRKSYVCAIV